MSGPEKDLGKLGLDSSELRIFISEALQAVMAGISDAQPRAFAMSSLADGDFVFSFEPPEKVDFDIAVSAKRTGTVGGGLGGGLKLEVFSVGANRKSEKSHESTTISRIAFSVPTLPQRIADA